MNRNTLSLLNSPWLVTDAQASALMPSFISMIKGNAIADKEPEVISVFAHYDDEEWDGEASPEFVSDMDTNGKYIPILSIKNAIFKYDQSCGPRGTRTMMQMMKAWEQDDRVLGVVLDIDSGGGQAAGTPEFADFILNYSKPNETYTDGNVCSAAYWIAASTNKITANPNADFIGSIGTKISYVNLKGILTKEGAVIKDIFATKSTRKSEEERAMDAGDETLVIQNILDPYNDRFANGVTASRPGMNAEVFTGATFLPDAALQMGLIDRIGTLQDVLDSIVAQAKPTSTSNNQNSHTNMSKTRANVQAALGLDAPLAETDKGSYLNAEQLDTLDNALATADAAKAKAEGDLAAVQATVTDKDGTIAKLTADLATAKADATTATSNIEATVNTMLEASGLEATGTLDEKLTALNGHLAVVNKEDGAAHTVVKTAGSEAAKTYDFLDMEASHNKIASQL